MTIELTESELVALSNAGIPAGRSSLQPEIPRGGAAIDVSMAAMAGAVSGGHAITRGMAGVNALIEGSIFAF